MFKFRNNLNIRKFAWMAGASSISFFVCLMSGEIDSIIAGNQINEQALSAVGIVVSISTLMYFISTTISGGAPVLFTKKMGEYKEDEAYKVIGTSVIYSIILGIVMALLLWLFRDDLLAFFGLTDELYTYCCQYYEWFIILAIFMPFNWLVYQLVYMDGNEKLTASSDFLQFILNTTLSVILCRHYGLSGISLSTTISVFLVTCYLCIHFFTKKCSIKFKFWFSFKHVLESFKLSISLSADYLFASITSIFANKMVIVLFGAFYLPILNIIVFATAVSQVTQSVSSAATPFICNYHAEKNSSGVISMLKVMFVSSLIVGLIVAVILFVFSESIPVLFGITSPELAIYSAEFLRAFAIFVVCVPLLYMITQYFLLTDRTIIAFLSLFVNLLVSPVVCLIVGSLNFGIEGLVWGYALYPLASFVVVLLIVFILKGKAKLPYLLPEYNKQSKNIHIEVKEENVEYMQREVLDFISKFTDEKIRMKRFILFCESMIVTIIENNKDNKKKVFSEISIIVDDTNVTLIQKDNGLLYNQGLYDNETKLTSREIVKYYVSNKPDQKNYMKSTGFNQYSFTLNYKK